jgi:hypothetical protein
MYGSEKGSYIQLDLAHLTSGEALEEVGLAASIHAKETIPTANGELDRAVLD